MKVKYALVLLSLLISSMELFAQEVIELKGCVYDEQKAPVPGAAVYLKTDQVLVFQQISMVSSL